MTTQVRAILPALLLAAFACSRPAADPFPESLAGGWKRVSEAPETAVPETLRALGCKQARRFEYEGAGRVAAVAYQMTSEAGAFEALQRWRAEPGAVPFHKKEYLVVVRGAPDPALMEFAGALERAMK